MKKSVAVGLVSLGAIITLGAIGSSVQPQSTGPIDAVAPVSEKTENKEPIEKIKPTCDGTLITSNCTLDGVNYAKYVYHQAVAEKTHVETITTYKKVITGYCTLCNDGTRSPSCATGRGACSHHGGVAQWNAPIYSEVPEYSYRTVIDAPAQDAYYEKIIEQ